MNDLFKAIIDLIENGKVPEGIKDLLVKEDENGKVVISYLKPRPPKELVEFKSYVDSLDDDIFEASCLSMRLHDPDSYNIISQNIITDLNAYVNATLAFKFHVKRTAQAEYDKLKSQNDSLYATINTNKQRMKVLEPLKS